MIPPDSVASRAWLAAIVESSDDAIVSKDLNGIVTSWNPAAERIFGYAAHEMIGQPILRIIPESLRYEEDHILSRIREGKRIEQFETVRQRKDGKLIHISVSISPVRDAGGRVIGASKIARAIDEQREAERTRALLAAIVDSSESAIYTRDLSGLVTTWNPAATRLFGHAADEIVGSPAVRLIPTELREEEELLVRRIHAGERIDRFETVRLARDGKPIEVVLAISAVRDAQGSIIGISHVLRDARPQRDAERAQATLAAIVTGSDDAIISKTLDGIVTSWNPAAERLYGFTAGEMVGESILRIIPPELYAEEDYILGKIRGGERIDHFETVRMRKDGSTVEVSLTVSPVRDSLGRLIGASKIARDISYQREERRRKDQVLAILAHELRNPLSAIRYSLAFSKRPGLREEERTKAHLIAERQLAHMARLLDDLLDVSRIATGRVELKRRAVTLGELVEDAIAATRALYAERDHQLTVAMPGEPVWLDADPARITQILVNLLTNSAKYTDNGGRVALEAVREGDEIEIRVSDNGIGFDATMKERLFGLFNQDDDALGRAAGGLGIGLALVREFVERHGGRVDGHSAGRGTGSRFTVRLPTIPAPEPVQAAQVAHAG